MHEIPVIYARIISTAAGLTNSETNRILQGTGIDEQSAPGQSRGMSYGGYTRLLQNAVQVSEDPLIVLKAGIGMDQPITSHGPVGLAVITSPTLKVALDTISDYLSLRSPFCAFSLLEEGDTVILQMDLDEAALGEQAELALDFILSIVLRGMAGVSPTPLTNIKLELKRQAPAYASSYEVILPCRIAYGASRNAYYFPNYQLEQPLPGANPEEYAVALERCKNIYTQYSQASTLSQRVLDILSRRAGHICKIKEVSHELNMSVSKLQRLLSRENQSFQALRDQCLSRLALQYLEDENLSAEITASLLGYTDSANFCRAFKRWFGKTPGRHLSLNSK